MTVVVTLSGMTVSLVQTSVDRSRAAGAAWHMAALLRSARFEAVKRSAFVAIRFTPEQGDYRYAAFVDGNRNGVLTKDIGKGIDRRISLEERLDQHFPHVTFGIWHGVTAIEAGEALDLNDPIQIGRSSLMSFSPDGSATAGTLYIRGRGSVQFAVRVLGVSARTRVLRFDFGDRRWRGP